MNLEEVMKRLPEEMHSILANCDSLTLHALKPGKYAPQNFYGHLILRSTQIQDAREIRRIVVALYQGMTDESGWQARCFYPHHGVRATFGERYVDLVLCYWCGNLQIFLNGQQLGFWWSIAGPSKWLLDDLLKPPAST